MIYLIIGPSCSGKTQLVTNSFIKNSHTLICTKDIIKVTECDSCYLIGDFTINKKIRGTDVISKSQLKLIPKQIIKLLDSDKDIVAEGVNLCWSFVFDELLPYKNEIKLIYLQCSKEISLSRNHLIHSTAKDSSFKAMWTRTDNIFNKYCKYFDSYVYCTDSIDNFETFSLNTILLKKTNSISKLFN